MRWVWSHRKTNEYNNIVADIYDRRLVSFSPSVALRRHANKPCHNVSVCVPFVRLAWFLAWTRIVQIERNSLKSSHKLKNLRAGLQSKHKILVPSRDVSSVRAAAGSDLPVPDGNCLLVLNPLPHPYPGYVRMYSITLLRRGLVLSWSSHGNKRILSECLIVNHTVHG
jgi:hypothetical protein